MGVPQPRDKGQFAALVVVPYRQRDVPIIEGSGAVIERAPHHLPVPLRGDLRKVHCSGGD